jgi:hypothetical protein
MSVPADFDALVVAGGRRAAFVGAGLPVQWAAESRLEPDAGRGRDESQLSVRRRECFATPDGPTLR